MRDIKAAIRAVLTGQALWYGPHRYYSWLRARQVEQTRPVACAPAGDDAPELHMLSGARHVPDALFAAKSFLLHFGAPLRVFVHLDRSADDAVIARLQHHLPNVITTTAPQRDAVVTPELHRRGLTACLELRKELVLAAKLFDVPMYCGRDRFMLIDTDVLVFSDLARLRTWWDTPSQPSLFGKDPASHPYSQPAHELRERMGFDTRAHVNSGFLAVHRSTVNWELIETWLTRPGYPMRHHYSEQTIFAALFTAHPAEMLDQAEFNMGYTAGDDCIAIHYCGHYLGPTRIGMRRGGQRRVLQLLGSARGAADSTDRKG